MSDTSPQTTPLERCQAFNKTLVRHIAALIEMIDAGNPPPTPAALKLALEGSLRKAALAGGVEAAGLRRSSMQ